MVTVVWCGRKALQSRVRNLALKVATVTCVFCAMIWFCSAIGVGM